MELLTRGNETIISLNHPDQFESINNLFGKYGDKIAGVVTEFPTNPLLHSCDLEQVSQLCRIHNSLLIVDPTMASPKNAKVSPYADIVINSLTKYANWEGDVMLGSLGFPFVFTTWIGSKRIHRRTTYQAIFERFGKTG